MNNIDAVLMVGPKELIPKKTYGSWEKYYKNLFYTKQERIDNVNSTWVQELKVCIKKTTSEFILISPYDFICLAAIPPGFINSLKNLNADYCRLVLRPGVKTKTKGIMFENHELFKLELNNDYSINLQPSIWRSGYIYKILSNSEIEKLSIWEFDRFLYKYLTKNQIKNSYVSSFKKRILSSHYVKKGKQFRNFDHKSSTLYPSSIKEILEYNIKLEIQKKLDFIIHKINTIF